MVVADESSNKRKVFLLEDVAEDKEKRKEVVPSVIKLYVPG